MNYNKYLFVFIGYIRVVEKALSTYDSDCVIQIKRAVQDVIASFKTTRGADIIKDKFKYIIHFFRFIQSLNKHSKLIINLFIY